MLRKFLYLSCIMVLLFGLVPVSHSGIVFLVGDKDGFGFAPEDLVDAVSIAGDPADTNGNGKLQPGEFLPEINGNYTFDECPPPDGDGFDHRTDDEIAAVNGAQFTDVSFRSEGDVCLGSIRMNTVSFEFDTASLAGLVISKAKLKFVYADFDGDCPSSKVIEGPPCYDCTGIFADDELIGNVPLTEPRQGGISRASFDVPIELLDDEMLTITFESIDSIEFDYAALIVSLATQDVKPSVSLRVRDAVLDCEAVPGGPGGTYRVDYRLKNKSAFAIYLPFLKFKPKQTGILLLNADGGPGGDGATFTPDVGSDLLLAPEEKTLFTIVIGLEECAEADYKFKVRGHLVAP